MPEMEQYKPVMVCPKCHSDVITTDYDKVNDLLNRKCVKCNYEFIQLPLDRDKLGPAVNDTYKDK